MRKAILWGPLLALLWSAFGVILAHANHDLLPMEGDYSLPSTPPPSRAGDSWLTRDKRLHVTVSAGMVAAGFHLLHQRWQMDEGDSRNLAVSLTALAGVIKEVTDRGKNPPTCSYKDLLADGLGILAGVFLFTR